MESKREHSIKKYFRSRSLAGIIFVVALSVRFFNWFDFGGWNRSPRIVRTPDSADFLATCDLWLAAPIDQLLGYRGLLFSGFTGPLCSVLGVTDGSLHSWIVLQIILSAITPVLVLLTAKRAVNTLAGLVAGGLIAVLFEVVRYDVYVLSDSIFVFVLSLSLYSVTRYWDEPTRQNRLFVYACLIWLGITRPVGPPVLILWMVYDLIPWRNKLSLGLVSRPTAIGALIGLIAISLYFYSFSNVRSESVILRRLVHGEAVTQFPDWANYWGLIRHEYVPRSSSGVISFFVFNLDHIFITLLQRVVLFFYPYIESPWWASWKVAYNAVLMTLIESATFYGIYRMSKNRRELLVMWVTPLAAFFLITLVNPIDPSLRRGMPAAVIYSLISGYVIGTSPLVRASVEQFAFKIRQLVYF